MFAESTAIFLADFGVPASATIGGILHQASVILDVADQEILSGHALTPHYQITYRSADLPPMLAGQAITVNGITYRVIDAMRIDDGVFSRAMLEI